MAASGPPRASSAPCAAPHEPPGRETDSYGRGLRVIGSVEPRPARPFSITRARSVGASVGVRNGVFRWGTPSRTPRQPDLLLACTDHGSAARIWGVDVKPVTVGLPARASSAGAAHRADEGAAPLARTPPPPSVLAVSPRWRRTAQGPRRDVDASDCGIRIKRSRLSVDDQWSGSFRPTSCTRRRRGCAGQRRRRGRLARPQWAARARAHARSRPDAALVGLIERVADATSRARTVDGALLGLRRADVPLDGLAGRARVLRRCRRPRQRCRRRSGT